MSQPPLPAADLEMILQQTSSLWKEIRNQRIFITGGTGFFGCWLLESFLYANRTLDLKAHATVLSRDPGQFSLRAPHIAENPAITFLKGEIRNFEYPAGEFTYVIHAAADVAVVRDSEDPLERLMGIQEGTAHTLRFASTHSTRKYLLVSSGAVYGPQPLTMTHIPEDFLGAPATWDRSSSYGEGKRASELMCTLFAGCSDIEFKIARCFAFAGPGLPLDANFAIGNFVEDVMRGRTVHVAGDGTPLRSYLYAADLTVWLWTILFRAPSLEIFNVGSEDAVSIGDLARKVVETMNSRVAVEAGGQFPNATHRKQYVPSTRKANRVLQLSQTVGLEESIRRMAAWHSFNAKL